MQHEAINGRRKDDRVQKGTGNVHERRRYNEPQIDDLVRKLSSATHNTTRNKCEKGAMRSRTGMTGTPHNSKCRYTYSSMHVACSHKLSRPGNGTHTVTLPRQAPAGLLSLEPS